MILLLKATGLFALTALAEILGCFLVYRCLRLEGSLWLLPPAAVSLGVFAWLLTLHPGVAGRTYAAYGAVYIASAVLWLWLIEGQRPTLWDTTGAAVCLAGAGIILLGTKI